MSIRITPEERERMYEFATTPKYARDPEMLVPAQEEETPRGTTDRQGRRVQSGRAESE